MTRICLTGIAVVCLCIVRLAAESPRGSPREITPRTSEFSPPETPEELNRHLQRDLADRKLHDFSLFQAALVVGGVKSRQELHRRTDQFHDRCHAIVNELKPITDTRLKVERLAHRFHGEFLSSGYRAGYSELPRTLDSGHFNCVSATILFQAVASQCGLEPVALASASHVFTSLPGEPTLYIETTRQDWHPVPFPACPLEMQARVLESRPLTEVQLLGKVYYNRGVSALEARRFDDAFEALQAAERLDEQDQSARENLLATFNNWALAESEAGRYHHAVELVLQGLATAGDHSPLLTNDIHIHQKWVTQLCDDGNFAAAVQVLEQGYLRRPNAELFERGRVVTPGLWATHHFQRGELEAGWQVLQEARRRRGLRLEPQWEISVVQAACDELLGQGQWAVTRRLLEHALDRYPAEPELLKRQRDLPPVGT